MDFRGKKKQRRSLELRAENTPDDDGEADEDHCRKETFLKNLSHSHAQDKRALIFLCKATVVDELVIFSCRCLT